MGMRVFWLCVFALCSVAPFPVAAETPVYGYRVVRTLPHATENYTEGFLYLDGHFYEGTGREGHSLIEETDPQTARVVREHQLPADVFGEGIVDWGNTLYQWTWQTHVGYIFDRTTLEPRGEFHYTGEGWGMTHDATQLITSDGTATLRFRDPLTFAETGSIVVRDNLLPVTMLNELEYVKGEIYANVWHTDRIARIDPKNGRVIAWIDLTGLLPAAQKLNEEAVLNGIAYDAEHDRLYVTGKQWPLIFEIRLVAPAARDRH